MGLDQYLYAKRRFPRGCAQADRILAAARIELVDLAGRDLDNDEDISDGGIYLADWEYDGMSERRLMAQAVLREAGLDRIATPESGSGYLTFDVATNSVEVQRACCYWRKANAVHAWFVDNVQDGVDECQQSRDIDAEELAHLMRMCDTAYQDYQAGRLDDARVLMPPREGFFFGGYAIDEGYAWDLQNTIGQLTRVLQIAIDLGPPMCTFYYQSSW